MVKQRYLKGFLYRVKEVFDKEDPTTEEIMALIFEMMEGGTTD